GSPPAKQATELDRLERLLELFKNYNSVGLTAIIDRDTSASAINLFKKLRDGDRLTLRVACSRSMGSGDIEGVRKLAADPLCKPSTHLRIIGIKNYLDGGMLTGSAYMLRPWGVSKIYSITDSEYRGMRYIPKDRLRAIVQTTVESGLQYTAHSVGDGAVHA